MIGITAPLHLICLGVHCTLCTLPSYATEQAFREYSKMKTTRRCAGGVAQRNMYTLYSEISKKKKINFFELFSTLSAKSARNPLDDTKVHYVRRVRTFEGYF